MEKPKQIYTTDLVPGQRFTLFQLPGTFIKHKSLGYYREGVDDLFYQRKLLVKELLNHIRNSRDY